MDSGAPLSIVSRPLQTDGTRVARPAAAGNPVDGLLASASAMDLPCAPTAVPDSDHYDGRVSGLSIDAAHDIVCRLSWIAFRLSPLTARTRDAGPVATGVREAINEIDQLVKDIQRSVFNDTDPPDDHVPNGLRRVFVCLERVSAAERVTATDTASATTGRVIEAIHLVDALVVDLGHDQLLP